MRCLFCQSEGPFSEEHIIPASLGNDDLTLRDQVCAACNNYFSRDVEAEVLHKSPLAFWRTFLGIKTRKGKLPSVDLSQPRRPKGTLACTHPRHDDGVGFTAHDDGTCSADISNDDIIRQMLDKNRSSFKFVLTPTVLRDLGKLLCKMGVELVCLSAPDWARSDEFKQAREYARFGNFRGLWPVFHFSLGTLRDLRKPTDAGGTTEEVQCYTFQLLEVPPKYVLLQFGMGTDQWVVCINDPFPTPDITAAFPGAKVSLLWYSPDQLAKSNRTTS